MQVSPKLASIAEAMFASWGSPRGRSPRGRSFHWEREREEEALEEEAFTEREREREREKDWEESVWFKKNNKQLICRQSFSICIGKITYLKPP